MASMGYFSAGKENIAKSFSGKTNGARDRHIKQHALDSK